MPAILISSPNLPLTHMGATKAKLLLYKTVRTIHGTMHVLVIPITLVVDTAHKGAAHTHHLVHKKRVQKCAVGLVLMLSGSALGSIHLELIPEFIWHAITWGLHGYGATPFVKILCEKMDLEHLEDPPPPKPPVINHYEI